MGKEDALNETETTAPVPEDTSGSTPAGNTDVTSTKEPWEDRYDALAEQVGQLQGAEHFSEESLLGILEELDDIDDDDLTDEDKTIVGESEESEEEVSGAIAERHAGAWW